MNLDNKTIFLSGGTGSFGKKFIYNALKKLRQKKLIKFRRHEKKQN